MQTMSHYVPLGIWYVLHRCMYNDCWCMIDGSTKHISNIAVLSLFILLLRLDLTIGICRNCLLSLDCKFHKGRDLYRFIIDVFHAPRTLPCTERAVNCSMNKWGKYHFMVSLTLLCLFFYQLVHLVYLVYLLAINC